MLVYTTGSGVHGFTLDPTIGEFLLSHPHIRTPEVGKYYSVNESHWDQWTPGVQRAVAAFKNGDGAGKGRVEAKNARYIRLPRSPISIAISCRGASSFILPTRARRKASSACCTRPRRSRSSWSRPAVSPPTAANPILDLTPATLHQRTPLVIGSKADVDFATEVIGSFVSDRKPVYGPGDWRGIPRGMFGAPGAFPFTRGVPPVDVWWQAVDDAPVRGFRDRRGHERAFRHLLAAGQTGLSVGVRPSYADGIRLGSCHG